MSNIVRVKNQKSGADLFTCRFQYLPRQGDLLRWRGVEYVVEETEHKIMSTDTCQVSLLVLTMEEFLKEFPNGIREKQPEPFDDGRPPGL